MLLEANNKSAVPLKLRIKNTPLQTPVSPMQSRCTYEKHYLLALSYFQLRRDKYLNSASVGFHQTPTL